jgi:hypothetical protein
MICPSIYRYLNRTQFTFINSIKQTLEHGEKIWKNFNGTLLIISFFLSYCALNLNVY